MAAVHPIFDASRARPLCCEPKATPQCTARGNTLGFQLPPAVPKCGGNALGVCLPSGYPKPCFPCAPPSTVAHPLSYESETLQPYKSYVTPVDTYVNVVKTIPHAGYLFTLASVTDPYTSELMTVLSRVLASDTNGTTRKTVSVQMTDATNPENTVPLVFATSMTALDKYIYIVGFNRTEVTFYDVPVIAKVHVETLEVLLWIGNGEPVDSPVISEAYQDVTVGFCIPGISTEPLLAVCGYVDTGSLAGIQASLRLINLNTMLPVLIFGTGQTYAALSPPSPAVAYGISVVANFALGMYNVLCSFFSPGVQCAIASVSRDGTALPSLLQYNDPVTNVLRGPTLLGFPNEFALQLACTSDGTLYALTRGRNAATDIRPSEILLLYKFTPDTSPALGFGTSGIVSWWDPTVGAAVASALVVTECDNQVYVTGNSFAAFGNEYFMYYGGRYNFPVRLGLASPTELTANPVPFVIRVAGSNGCVGVVLNSLPNCPCNDFTFAVGVCFAGPGVLYVSGMVAKDLLGTPAVVSGLLTLFLSLHTHPARVVNCSPVTVNILNGYCNGFVGIANPCAPTTVLQVQGPIVVGNSNTPPALPGAIRFEDGNLLVYDGTTWQALAFSFSVTYDANGGTFPPSGQSGAAGSSIAVKEPGPMSKPGSSFAGWNTQPNGTGIFYNPGDTLILNQNVILYAQWQEVGGL